MCCDARELQGFQPKQSHARSHTPETLHSNRPEGRPRNKRSAYLHGDVSRKKTQHVIHPRSAPGSERNTHTLTFRAIHTLHATQKNEFDHKNAATKWLATLFHRTRGIAASFKETGETQTKQQIKKIKNKNSFPPKMSEEESPSVAERSKHSQTSSKTEGDSPDKTYQKLEAAIKKMLKNTVSPLNRKRASAPQHAVRHTLIFSV